MLDVLDGDGVRRWCTTALRRLRAGADELDRLNVYPVRDGDTGVNLVTTVRHLCEQLPDGEHGGEVLAAVSHAALMGANGNSGTILSQLLRGVAEVGAGAPALTATGLAAGLRRGADLAYAGVLEPVEGTILTVARLAADAAEAAAGDGAGLAGVARAAAGAAREALASTPDLLPELAAAGVVDAGGQGWCLVLDALAEVVGGPAADGSHRDATDDRDDRDATGGADGGGADGGGADAEPPPVVPRPAGGPPPPRESGGGYAYEVQYLLDAPREAAEALRARLATLGDSLVLVGSGELWNVHVHVDDVGAAVEAGIEAGRPHRITVTRFADQVAADAAPEAPGGQACRVVAVVDGPELAALAAAAGARPVEVPAGEPVTAAPLLAAVADLAGPQVVLLPNRGDAADAVDAVVATARAEGRTVAVVPTRSVAQGLAALAVHDPARAFADDLVGMASAAAATRTVTVTVGPAAGAGAGPVRGLLDGAVLATGDDLFAVAAEMLDRVLIAGGDLVTLVTADAADDLGHRLRAYLAASRPHVEVQHHRGGAAATPLVAGVE